MLKGHVFKEQRFGNHIFALFINTFLAGHNGIVNGYKNSMRVSYSGSNVTIASGAVCIQGRFLEEDSSTTLNAGTNTLFCKLVLEIDLDQENTESEFNQGSYKIITGANDYPTLTQDDIVASNTGVYQYELARFKTGTSGITNFVDKRTFIDFDSIYQELEEESDIVFEDELTEILESYLLETGGTMIGELILTEGLRVNSTGKTKGIEMYGNTPYIDFHFNNSSADYTSRLIESQSGTLVIDNANGLVIQKGNITVPQFVMSKSGAKILDDSTGNIFIRTGASRPIYCRSITGDTVYVPIVASAFQTASSRRYKENIIDMTEDEANKILDINIVKFDYKEKQNGTNVAGVIAEDVYEILPNVVALTEVDGKEVPDGVDYSKFSPYLIKVEQIHDKRITKLEEHAEKQDLIIKQQDERIANLEAIVEELKSKIEV